MAILSAVFGVGVFASVLFTALPTFSAVQREIPFLVTMLWGGALVVGGVGVVTAMLLRGRWPNAEMGEAVLLPSLATGWAVYAVGLGLGLGWAGIVPILVGVLIATAAILRIRAIVLSYRIRTRVARIREETS